MDSEIKTETKTPPKRGVRQMLKAIPGWLDAIVVIWALPVVLTGLVWAIGLPVTLVAGFCGWKTWTPATWNRGVWYTFVRRDFFPGWNVFAHGTMLFWVLVAILMAISILACTVAVVPDEIDDAQVSVEFKRPHLLAGARRTAAWLTIVGTGLAVILAALSVWDNDKREAQAFNASVEFVVPNTDNLPAQLQNLATVKTTANGCELKGKADVPACVVRGDLTLNWVARNASAEAAADKLAKASTGASNTYVMTTTLTYLYEGSGLWSAVRDGKNRQPLDAVVEWDGQHATTECRFTGAYAINGAFQGAWHNSLTGALAAKFPKLFYNLHDVWGYCNGKEPVVVVPVTQQVTYGHRTVMYASGVLTIRGDHGKTVITHIRDPRSGDKLATGQLPGPVYPKSLAQKARNLIEWAAGRGKKDRNNFGFEPTTATSQYGNATEYLLKDTQTGELEWVTPLTPRGSDSQQLVAWAVVPAGYSLAGTLNTTRIYVFADNDPRIINLGDLTVRAKKALSATDQAFFSAQGKIVEFLPVTAHTWQAYGELGGRVLYRVDIPTDSQASASVINLTGGPPTAQKGSGDICGQPVSRHTNLQDAYCLKRFSDDLNKRLNSGPFKGK